MAEIAKEIGVGRESVRQIEMQALQKLCTTPLRDRFREYV
jgi:DNA-directed RNA polymerase sigma subunit (sigma70/sigma32)